MLSNTCLRMKLTGTPSLSKSGAVKGRAPDSKLCNFPIRKLVGIQQLKIPLGKIGFLPSVKTFSAGSNEVGQVGDDIAQKALSEYVGVSERSQLETLDDFATYKELESVRHKYGIRRMADGRLQLRNSKGEWFQCRLDMEISGSMLLRSPEGYIFALQTEKLEQLDISDDMVVFMLFADGKWQEQMIAIQFYDDEKNVQQLKIESQEFREVLGLLKSFYDKAEEPMNKAPDS